MAMLIDKVYKAVQLLAAKDNNSGYISPLEYSRFAELAQLDIVTERYNSYKIRGYGSDYDNDDMFSELKASSVLTLSSGSVTKPTDYLHFSTAHGYQIFNGEGRLRVADYVNDVEWIERLASEINRPTEEFPILRGKGSNFEVEPQTINQVHLSYIKLPLEPFWNYTISGREPVFAETGGVATNPNAGVTAGDSTDFTIDDSEFSDLVFKICKYFGIEVRDANLYQMIEAENVSDE